MALFYRPTKWNDLG